MKIITILLISVFMPIFGYAQLSDEQFRSLRKELLQTVKGELKNTKDANQGKYFSLLSYKLTKSLLRDYARDDYPELINLRVQLQTLPNFSSSSSLMSLSGVIVEEINYRVATLTQSDPLFILE